MHGRKWLILIAAGALTACQGSRQQARSSTATGAAAPAASGQADDARQRDEQRAQQQPPAGTGAPGASPDARDELTGRIALVDPAQHEIAIDSGTATTQVKVADSARITVDGKQASFADIRQGASVRARLDRSGEEPQAVQVEVTPSRKASK